METFFLSVLSSSMVAAGLAVAILLLGRYLRSPAVLHLLWVVVLVKLFVPPVLELALLPAPSAVEISVEGVVAGVAGAPAQVIPAGPGVWTAVAWSLVALWVIGSLAVLAVTLVRLRRFRQVLSQADPVDQALAERIDTLAAAVGCSRRPQALVTDAPMSPLVWSTIGRPRLVLPRQLMAKLSGGQLDTILAHELAHLKRGDDRVRWIELAALIVFWWNPTTWIASRFLRDAEEACCDAIVARALPTQIEDYAQSLVQAVRHLMAPEPSPLVAASGLGRPALMERRIRTMFNKKTTLPLSVPARLLVVLTAVIVLGLSPMLTAREGDENAPSTFDYPNFDQKISLQLQDADIRDVFQTMSAVSGIKFELTSEVSGTVTVDWKDIRLGPAIGEIIHSKGLDAIMSRAGVMWVGKPETLQRKIFEMAGKENPPATFSDPRIEGDLEGRPLYRYVEEGTITEPMRFDGPHPRYPEQARSEGINGAVVMEVVIGEDGSVREVEVVQSNANVLSEAAVEAVEQWTFKPATLEGVPVAVRYILTVNFRLQ